MKTIKINGTAVTLTSKVKLKEFEFVNEYGKEALRLTDENGNDTFIVTFGWEGTLETLGAIISRANDKGYAEITIKLPDCIEDVKDYFTKNYFEVVENFNKVEEQVITAYKDLNAKFNAFAKTIKTDDDKE